jgi:MFS family permease
MTDRQYKPPRGSKPRLFYGYIVVISAFLCMMTIFGLYVSFGVFLKPILSEFGWTRAATSGAFSLSMIVHGFLGIFMGGINDRFGPRLVLSLSGVLLGLGFVLVSQVSTLWQLYLFYSLIGAGVSGGWVPLLSTVARWFVRRRGAMSGIVLCGTCVGGFVFPPLATQLIAINGWRPTFVILGMIAAVVIIAAQFLRLEPGRMGQAANGKPDESLDIQTIPNHGLTLEQALPTRHFWLFFLLLFCSGFCMYSAMVHIVPHATEMGFSPVLGATVLSAMSVISIAGRLGLGAAADAIGGRNVFMISFALMAGAFIWVVTVPEVWGLYIFAAFFGVSYGGLGVVESPLVAQLFGLRSHGLIFGVLVLGWTLGASVGPLVAGYLFDLLNGYIVAFLLSSGVGVVGLIFTWMLGTSRPVDRLTHR